MAHLLKDKPVTYLTNQTLKGVYLAQNLPLALRVVYFCVAAVTPHHLKCVVLVAFVLKMNPRLGRKVARMRLGRGVWPGIGAVSQCIR